MMSGPFVSPSTRPMITILPRNISCALPSTFSSDLSRRLVFHFSPEPPVTSLRRLRRRRSTRWTFLLFVSPRQFASLEGVGAEFFLFKLTRRYTSTRIYATENSTRIFLYKNLFLSGWNNSVYIRTYIKERKRGNLGSVQLLYTHFLILSTYDVAYVRTRGSLNRWYRAEIVV